MDKEQINELKPGDEVLIRGMFKKIKENGDFQVSYLLTTVHGKLYMYKAAVHPSAVIIKSPPQHDPCRPFRKGDKVKLTKWNGRICEKLFREGIFCGENLTVVRDEDCFLNVTVSIKQGLEIAVLSPFLELVTPVDERNPYSVHEESTHNRWNVIKDKYVHGVHAMFPYKNMGNSDLMSREEAKARADEYSDRLNAEYRKELGNEKIYS